MQNKQGLHTRVGRVAIFPNTTSDVVWKNNTNDITAILLCLVPYGTRIKTNEITEQTICKSRNQVHARRFSGKMTNNIIQSEVRKHMRFLLKEHEYKQADRRIDLCKMLLTRTLIIIGNWNYYYYRFIQYNLNKHYWFLARVCVPI